jgi:hypothetical protein
LDEKIEILTVPEMPTPMLIQILLLNEAYRLFQDQEVR